jgi:hypothetical protein
MTNDLISVRTTSNLISDKCVTYRGSAHRGSVIEPVRFPPPWSTSFSLNLVFAWSAFLANRLSGREPGVLRRYVIRIRPFPSSRRP